MNAEDASSGFDISPADTYFLPSAGLSDAQATYICAAIVFGAMIWIAWKNRKDLS
jgi:hypothetical protein